MLSKKRLESQDSCEMELPCSSDFYCVKQASNKHNNFPNGKSKTSQRLKFESNLNRKFIIALSTFPFGKFC